MNKVIFLKLDLGTGHRNWDTGDCTVRALALAKGISYPNAWQLLYQIQGEQRACAFRLPEFLKRNPKCLGAVKYLTFPGKKGQPRMTAQQFCQIYSTGRYILRMARHVACVRDGILVDTWNSSKKCVYGAWEFS